MIGQKITDIRQMSVQELEREGWEGREIVPVIVLENGDHIYPSRDDEGNGPGALFGISSEGAGFYVTPQRP